MSLSHEQGFIQQTGMPARRVIPPARHFRGRPEPEILQVPLDGMAAPGTAGIRFVSKETPELDIPPILERNLTMSNKLISPGPAARLLDKLGGILFHACKGKGEAPLLPEDLGRYFDQALEETLKEIPKGLTPQEVSQIMSQLTGQKESLLKALGRIPAGVFAETDSAHTKQKRIAGGSTSSAAAASPGGEKNPDISELLALEAYIRQNEQANPDVKPPSVLLNYHRGSPGQPDFVYRTGLRDVQESYDPLKLPYEDTVREARRWLRNAYADHAGGKGYKAACILDVSDATEAQLDSWIKIFKYHLDRIAAFLEKSAEADILQDKLMLLCNTYVVSYGANAGSSQVSVLQEIFDRARLFQKQHGGLDLLEKWRHPDEGEEMGLDDLFGST